MSGCKHRQRMDEIEAKIRKLDYEKELYLKSKAIGINDPRIIEINEELWRNIARQKEQTLMWMIGRHDEMEKRAIDAEKERDELKRRVAEMERALLEHYGPNFTTDRLLKKLDK